MKFDTKTMEKALNEVKEMRPNHPEIKIKLMDGTIREIEGLEISSCYDKDNNVIYIQELNPAKEHIKRFVKFAYKIMDVCEKEYGKVPEDGDPGDVIHIENEIAKLADWYIQKYKLQDQVKKEYGYYEPGAGDTDEVYCKIWTLKNFINL